MQRAIYVSDAVGSAGASFLSIAQILGVSDINNRRDQLTGVLLFHVGQFMQVIEGRRPDLDRLLARLEVDPRHTNMRVVVNDPVQDRRFGVVPMAIIDIDTAERAIIGDRPLHAMTLAEMEAVFASGLAKVSPPG